MKIKIHVRGGPTSKSRQFPRSSLSVLGLCDSSGNYDKHISQTRRQRVIPMKIKLNVRGGPAKARQLVDRIPKSNGLWNSSGTHTHISQTH